MLSERDGALFDQIWGEGARRIPRMTFVEALSAFADACREQGRAEIRNENWDRYCEEPADAE